MTILLNNPEKYVIILTIFTIYNFLNSIAKNQFMKRICGWCRTPLSDIDSAKSLAEQVSTGICPQCLHFFQNNRSDQPLSDFLENLKVPIVVLNEERRIQFANQKACRLLGKSLQEFRGSLPGEAFECAYARLPGGCGKTEHCKGCTIRRSVLKTFMTGDPQEAMTAQMTFMTPEGETEGRLKISTIKKGDLVYLRIDQFKTSPQI